MTMHEGARAMTDRVDMRKANGLLGALVADAAALGLHWIYDPDRIAQVAEAHGSAAFVPVDARNFEGVPAYFAHGAREDGQFTQYGEMLWLAMRSLQATGGNLDVSDLQAKFVETFGAGGSYAGYIDRPTRGTLDNLAAGQADPSGVDDDQMPAVARLPALVAAGAATPEAVDATIRVTNVNADASAYGQVFASVLQAVMDGASVADALKQAAATAPSEIAALLSDAVGSAEGDSVAYGEVTKRACHLPMGVPLSFHIMAHADGYADATERNIRAGGDSAGRAIIIGSIMGAASAPGDIPLDWVLSVHNAADIWALCQRVSDARP